MNTFKIGAFIKILVEILKDFVGVLFILAILVVGFAFAFNVLGNGRPGASASLTGNESTASLVALGPLFTTNDYTAEPLSVLTVFRMLLGDFDVNVFDLSRDRETMVVLFICFQILTTIVILNLLIAVMGETHSRVSAEMGGMLQLQRAKVLSELEMYLFQIRGWKRLVGLLFLMPSYQHTPRIFFPKWLHCLRIKSALSEESSVPDTTQSITEALQRVEARLAVIESRQASTH